VSDDEHEQPSEELQELLSEQVAYYRARAPEYENGALDALGLQGGDALGRAFEAFHWPGEVLELAPERVGAGARVRFVQADLFGWRPDRRYDVVFFAFWLSHVPPERFESFWALVAECLTPGGRVFFVDDSHRTGEELVVLGYWTTSPELRRPGVACRR
jgi:hypothetical protein